MLKANDLFNLDQTAHAALFADTEYVWEALPRIVEYIRGLLATTMPPNAHEMDLHPSVVIEGEVHIAPGAKIAPAVYLQGPSIIGENAEVRHGALIRAGTLLANGAVAGHTTETKNAVLLEGAAAPHFAYVGDSILGIGANLGAGTKLSNFPMNADKDPKTGKRPTVKIPYNGEKLDTHIVKFGAILGDGVNTGCNCVTNPGVIIGAHTMVYTLAMIKKGVYPANSIIKLRQTHEIVSIRYD